MQYGRKNVHGKGGVRFKTPYTSAKKKGQVRNLVTEFISDCDERWGEIRDMDGAFEYASGGHGGPYDEEDYNEYSGEFASVWLHKEHDVAKQMSFGQFVCDFLADFGNSDVIVKYEKDSIVLMRVE